MPKIFISYRREDSEDVAGRICDRLGAHFGPPNVFMDIDTIPFGVDFRKHIADAVSKCDVLLAVIGKDWLEARHREGPKAGQRRLDDPADFVRIELQAGLERNIPVIPVLVGKAGMPGEQHLPDVLKNLAWLNAAEVRSGRDFHDHMERLIHGIDKIHAASGPRPGEIVTNSIGMTFAWIPPGTFWMGSPDNERGRRRDEVQHKVTLTKGCYMSIYPVTQECWRKVMGEKETGFVGDQLPIEQVSWDECRSFLSILGERDGHVYRLPTEAEWEYACRAGTTTPFYFGQTISEQQALCDGSQTSMVGSFPPNAWGLFDMHGNVWEWCADRYGDYPLDRVVNPEGPHEGKYRVLRGGSFFNQAKSLRSASRFRQVPEHRGGNVGFRVVMNPAH
ncbi:hypothetical protein AYO40_06325 [Planctomycetaceae bacterium SCGC AG-212-D15]|nr:hypothetical protein AYO40_06325 [Planctomycetaceae bacterium SCGC AG-212-D15]